MRRSLHIAGWVFWTAATVAAAAHAAEPPTLQRPADQSTDQVGRALLPVSQPNIILILADDLGWSDVASNGGDLVETPHLDRLARDGVRFTQAYAPSPVCSPTRAALLTGKHPARLGITIWREGALNPPRNRRLLPPTAVADLPHSETTLAKHLQNAGYLTALVGKWHLGDAEHAPETHGFDINIGGTHWGAPQTFFWPYRGAGQFGPEFRYVPHLEFGRPGEYLTDRLTDEALRILHRAAQEQRPFFLYLAHHAPHTPIEAKPEDVKYFERKVRPELRHQNPVYAAMVKSLDDSVGRVLAHLNQRGLDQNTLVVFTSDNGGYVGVDAPSRPGVAVTSNAPLRSGKGTCYEGGLRVPLLVRWPGVTAAGAECHEPVILTDLFYTLAAAARRRTGTPARHGLDGQECPSYSPSAGDGLDLAGLLKNPAASLERDALFFHFPHYYHAPRSTPASAVRADDWKLIEYFEDDRVELYNLKDDPSETTDLAAQHPERTKNLRDRLHAWRSRVNARMPTANPAFQR